MVKIDALHAPAGLSRSEVCSCPLTESGQSLWYDRQTRSRSSEKICEVATVAGNNLAESLERPRDTFGPGHFQRGHFDGLDSLVVLAASGRRVAGEHQNVT